MKDLLVLLDGGTWRFATAAFGVVQPEDRVDSGDGTLCPVREIFRGVSQDVLKALQYAGEPVPEAVSLWRKGSLGEESDGR